MKGLTQFYNATQEFLKVKEDEITIEDLIFTSADLRILQEEHVLGEILEDELREEVINNE